MAVPQAPGAPAGRGFILPPDLIGAAESRLEILLDLLDEDTLRVVPLTVEIGRDPQGACRRVAVGLLHADRTVALFTGRQRLVPGARHRGADLPFEDLVLHPHTRVLRDLPPEYWTRSGLPLPHDPPDRYSRPFLALRPSLSGYGRLAMPDHTPSPDLARLDLDPATGSVMGCDLAPWPQIFAELAADIALLARTARGWRSPVSPEAGGVPRRDWPVILPWSRMPPVLVRAVARRLCGVAAALWDRFGPPLPGPPRRHLRREIRLWCSDGASLPPRVEVLGYEGGRRDLNEIAAIANQLFFANGWEAVRLEAWMHEMVHAADGLDLVAMPTRPPARSPARRHPDPGRRAARPGLVSVGYLPPERMSGHQRIALHRALTDPPPRP